MRPEDRIYRSGEVVRADTFNALEEAARKSKNVRTSGGLTVAHNGCMGLLLQSNASGNTSGAIYHIDSVSIAPNGPTYSGTLYTEQPGGVLTASDSGGNVLYEVADNPDAPPGLFVFADSANGFLFFRYCKSKSYPLDEYYDLVHPLNLVIQPTLFTNNIPSPYYPLAWNPLTATLININGFDDSNGYRIYLYPMPPGSTNANSNFKNTDFLNANNKTTRWVWAGYASDYRNQNFMYFVFAPPPTLFPSNASPQDFVLYTATSSSQISFTRSSPQSFLYDDYPAQTWERRIAIYNGKGQNMGPQSDQAYPGHGMPVAPLGPRRFLATFRVGVSVNGWTYFQNPQIGECFITITGENNS